MLTVTHYSATFAKLATKATEYGEMTQNNGHWSLRCSRSFKVTNRKPIKLCDFLLVI